MKQLLKPEKERKCPMSYKEYCKKRGIKLPPKELRLTTKERLRMNEVAKYSYEP